MVADIKQFFEVYPAQPQATIPVGIRINDMVFANGLAGIDPVTGEPAGDLVAQMSKILEHLQRLMERAGGSMDNVVRCSAYVTTMADREPIYEPWEALYPDKADRPGLKALLADLPPGHLVHLDAVGIIGGKRTRIDIPNITARDPAVKMGNWFFTSRCHGNDQTTGKIVEGGLEAETRQTFENFATLVKLAGGTEDNIVQINMFGRDDSYKEVARKVFEERFPDPAKRPVCHQMVNVVSNSMQISIEMMAAL
jgi:2-iminobutanoate/2-iminopropanoate deaminase